MGEQPSLVEFDKKKKKLILSVNIYFGIVYNIK